MTYKEYKIAVVGFYQINDSYNGASEVSLSLYDSLNCRKKLFDLKNPELLDSNPFFIFFYSYLIKPFRILFQVKKVLNFLNKSKKNEGLFDGRAEKILFFNDEEIHLIGNASMTYENVSVSSNVIIFNPQNGKLTSGW